MILARDYATGAFCPATEGVARGARVASVARVAGGVSLATPATPVTPATPATPATPVTPVTPATPATPATLLLKIGDRYAAGRSAAVTAVNRELVLTYWEIGRYIVELKRQKTAGLYERLARSKNKEELNTRLIFR